MKTTIFPEEFYVFAKNIVQYLNEFQRRIVIGALSSIFQYGGIKFLSEATGLSRNTIARGKREYQQENGINCTLQKEYSYNNPNVQKNFNKNTIELSRFGRPRFEDKNPEFFNILNDTISNYLYKDSLGDTYITLSLREVSKKLEEKDIKIHYSTISEKLRDLGVKVCRKKTHLKEINTQENFKYSYITIPVTSVETSAFDDFPDYFLSYNFFNSSFDVYPDYFLSYNYFNTKDSSCFSNKINTLNFDEYPDYFLSYNYFKEKNLSCYSNVEKTVDFDEYPDYFLSYDYFYTKCINFDEYPDYFLSYNYFDVKCIDFDEFPDYFLSRNYFDEKDYLTDEEIASLVLFISYLVNHTKKTFVRKKKHGKGKPFVKWKWIRKDGGGRHTITEKYSFITAILAYILDAVTYGDPERPLLWTSKSLRKLSDELKKYEIFAAPNTIRKILKELGYSRKQNRKLEQVGEKHPDSDLQMRIITAKIEQYGKIGYVTLSIDCKKKEILGNFANKGDDYCVDPIPVNDHDFKGKETKSAVPYGIFDITRNEGYVNIGLSKDTPEFAVHSLEKWWNEVGSKQYPDLEGIYITCDGGGSNSSKSIRFKLKLQEFSNKTGLTIVISHYPPGKSKYNKIEHRLFNLISNNWRGHPLYDICTILSYISSTKSKTGLKVHASIDYNKYETGIKSNKNDLRKNLIVFDDILGQWNYTIYPEHKREDIQHIIDEQWKKIDELKKIKKALC